MTKRGLSELRAQISKDITKQKGDPEQYIKSVSNKLPDFIPSPSLRLDFTINSAGVLGGIPVGHVIEIFGPEHAGKTTFAGLCGVNFQQREMPVVFIDQERKLNLQYMEQLGLHIYNDDLFQLLHADTMEQCFKFIEMAVDAGAKCVILDSIASLLPKAEDQGEMGDAHVGLVARGLGQFLRKIRAKLYEQGATLILINQIREKVGSYGNPETTPGGRGPAFYSSLRFRVSRKMGVEGRIGTEADPTGHWMLVKVMKNNFGRDGLKVEVPLIYGEGIDRALEFAELGEELGVVERSGSWFQLAGTDRKWQGKEKFAETLRVDTDLMNLSLNKLEALVKQRGVELEAALAAKRVV